LTEKCLAKHGITNVPELYKIFNNAVINNEKCKSMALEVEQSIRQTSEEIKKNEEKLRVAQEYHRQKAEAEAKAAALKAAVEEANKKALEAAMMKKEEQQSPKPNYKELKYKKYLTQESSSNQSLRANSKLGLDQHILSNDSSDSNSRLTFKQDV